MSTEPETTVTVEQIVEVIETSPTEEVAEIAEALADRIENG